MAATKAIHISPVGTNSNNSFIKEVEQIKSALATEIICLDCDQSKGDILKNSTKVFDVQPYYIILSPEMRLETFAYYIDSLYKNDLFRDEYRRNNGLWVVTYSSELFRFPEISFDDDVDGYYSSARDLIKDLSNAPHAWLQEVTEPDMLARINHRNMYCKKK